MGDGCIRRAHVQKHEEHRHEHQNPGHGKWRKEHRDECRDGEENSDSGDQKIGTRILSAESITEPATNQRRKQSCHNNDSAKDRFGPDRLPAKFEISGRPKSDSTDSEGHGRLRNAIKDVRTDARQPYIIIEVGALPFGSLHTTAHPWIALKKAHQPKQDAGRREEIKGPAPALGLCHKIEMRLDESTQNVTERASNRNGSTKDSQDTTTRLERK